MSRANLRTARVGGAAPVPCGCHLAVFFCPALRPHGQENFRDCTSKLGRFADRDALAGAIPSINYGSGRTHMDSRWVAFGYDWRFRLTFARSLGP